MAAALATAGAARAARTALVLLLAGVWGPRGAAASNASEPHPHQGLIPRLKLEGKPSIKLSASDLQAIEGGKLWMQSKEEGGVGRGLGVRDIAAPVDVVFGQISDLEGYVGKVPMLQSLKVYERSKKGAEVMEKATYVVRVIPGYNFEYYVEHHANKDKGVVLFYLDYGRHSDFNDMQGKWYIEEHPTKPGWTRVYYQCDIKLWGYAPAIVKTLLTSKGLSSAIGWVKKESEKLAPKTAAVPAFALFGAAIPARGGGDALSPAPHKELLSPLPTQEMASPGGAAVLLAVACGALAATVMRAARPARARYSAARAATVVQLR